MRVTVMQKGKAKWKYWLATNRKETDSSYGLFVYFISALFSLWTTQLMAHTQSHPWTGSKGS